VCSSDLNMTYNAEGKLSAFNVNTIITTFAYSGNTIIADGTNGGAFSSKRIITLNANGLAANVKTETVAGGATWYNDAYEYSGTQLIKHTYTNSSNVTPEITTCTWSGGNLISVSTASSTSTLEYYADKPAQTGDYLDLIQLIQGFRIYKTKNAVKSILNSGSSINNFSYNFADGKIVSVAVTGNTSMTYNYQYQCN
jgi:hypothetical protein